MVDVGVRRVADYDYIPSPALPAHPILFPSVWYHPSIPLLNIRIPLWLLAALCLAWPVTSFIVGRRRRRRGFAVEAVGQGSGVSRG